VSESRFLERAVALARASMESNRGGPFGAVIVRDGVVLGEAANAVIQTNDPTAHAEVMAIRDATSKLGDYRLNGAIIYASSEPCPMCLSAIYWARIDHVVYAAACDVAAAAGFDDTFFYEELRANHADRRVKIRQADLPEARALFEDWKRKPDKKLY
jgi:guanine deaminase